MAEESDVLTAANTAAPTRLTSELISTAVGELEARNIALERELEAKQRAATERDEHVASLERLLAGAQGRINELETATAEAVELAAAGPTAELAAAQRALAEERAGSAERIAGVQRLEAQLATSLHAAEEIQTRLHTVEASIADRDDRLRRSEGVIAELTEANATLRSELGEARTAAMDAVDEIMNLEQAAEDGQQASASVDARVAEIRRERDEGTARAVALESELETVRAVLEAAETIASDASVRVAEAEADAAELRREVHESRVRVEHTSQAAEAALDAARRRLTDADRELQLGLQKMQSDDDLSPADLLRLLAVHDVLMIVDGDHVANETFAGSDVTEARRRVCDAFAGDRSRRAATVQIVFDTGLGHTIPTSSHPATVVTAVENGAVAAALRDAVEATPLGHDVYVVGAATPVDTLRHLTNVKRDLAVALVSMLDPEMAGEASAAGPEPVPAAAPAVEITGSAPTLPAPPPPAPPAPEATDAAIDEIDLTTRATAPVELRPPGPTATPAARKPRWGEPPEPVAVVGAPRRPDAIEISPVHAEMPDTHDKPWWRRRS